LPSTNYPPDRLYTYRVNEEEIDTELNIIKIILYNNQYNIIQTEMTQVPKNKTQTMNLSKKKKRWGGG
jgi:hypothetical protein